MTVREVCPFHADDDVAGVRVSDEVGWAFTCDRRGHPRPGPYSWLRPPEAPDLGEMNGIAADMGLDVSLPAALREYRGTWVEYGVLERAFAMANPEDWHFLVDRYSHTAVAAKRYTVSAFLGGVLGRLWRNGVLGGISGEATGRWSYNRTTGYWALFPEPDHDRRLSWADSGFTVEYVPGQTEV